MNFDLEKSTIFLTLAGSRAYGFSNPDSDWDYRGICIAPLDSYLGVKGKFEQAVDGSTKHVWKHFKDGLVQPDSDMQVMELTKFCKLAAECNPSVIEILFSDESSIVLKHPVMLQLLEHRDMFLSKRAKARFSGYAMSQLNRIKRHKFWVDNPLVREPKREDYGLSSSQTISLDQIGAAEAIIQREIDGFMVDQNDLPEHTKIELNNGLNKMMRAVWYAVNSTPFPIGAEQKFKSTEEALSDLVMRQEGFSENFIEVLKKEKQYRSAKQEWNSYQKWLKERNPARAELEKKFGYDCKNAVHLVRLIRECREILETGKVNV